MDCFNYKRRLSSEVHVGKTPLGGANPIRIQSMANVSTMDTDAAVAQAVRMIKAGAEFVRFTAQGEREARNLETIRRKLTAEGYETPLVADIHFNPKAADEAALHVEKVRINPGNYIDPARTFKKITYTDEEYAAELQKIRERFAPFLDLCREHHTAIRIGVNHGSLSDRIMSRYGDTPKGMVESCMEFLRICAERRFSDVVLSIKASNTIVMIRAVRLLVRTMDAENMHYPLHLGVTEAGDGEDGRIKSAVGIGALLADGIGDTIRVSLSEAPEAEMPVADKLVKYITEREGHEPIKAVLSPKFDAENPARRKSRMVNGIGGNAAPAVLSDRTNGDADFDENLMPDWIFAEAKDVPKYHPCKNVIVNNRDWTRDSGTFPYFDASEAEKWKKCDARTKFLSLAYKDLDGGMMELLKKDTKTVVVLDSRHTNCVGEMRAFMHALMNADCDVPVILRRAYKETDKEMLQIKAAADFGALLADGLADGICLCNGTQISAKTLENYMFGILQAARARVSKTEYISCPGCGRTLFDLQKTVAQVKAATANMRGLKIGVMGCIVNGPGEMADADYGYVGAGRGKISLYKGKTCVLKNIPEDEAVEKLIGLINSDNSKKLPAS